MRFLLAAQLLTTNTAFPTRGGHEFGLLSHDCWKAGRGPDVDLNTVMESSRAQ